MSVYLDHNATTPLDERVLEAMLPCLRDQYGNPSSVHRQGRSIREAVERAREQVAALVNVSPSQVVFTSGGTEANNLALQGVWQGRDQRRTGLVVSAIEHASVLQTARALTASATGTGSGRRLDLLPIDRHGQFSEQALEGIVTDTTRLVSLMMANNETGVIQDVGRVAGKAREHGALFHTDAVQAPGKIRVDFPATGAHLMSLSAHKIQGPKGIGALIVDRAVDLQPLIHGGGQEHGLRSGTENVAGIVGFGAAAELAQSELEKTSAATPVLRNYLERRLDDISGTEIFARHARARLPNTVCFAVAGIDGETLMMGLDEAGFAVSSGSACDSHHHRPSHVLLAMGVDETQAGSAVRISLGRNNTRQDIDAFIAALAVQIDSFRSMSLQAWG